MTCKACGGDHDTPARDATGAESACMFDAHPPADRGVPARGETMKELRVPREAKP